MFTIQLDTDELYPASNMKDPLGKRFVAVLRAHRILLMSAVLGLPLVTALYWLMHAERIRFQGSIREGMSVHEVKTAVGEPAKVIEPGETIPKWGSALPDIAAFETWIYYYSVNYGG